MCWPAAVLRRQTVKEAPNKRGCCFSSPSHLQHSITFKVGKFPKPNPDCKACDGSRLMSRKPNKHNNEPKAWAAGQGQNHREHSCRQVCLRAEGNPAPPKPKCCAPRLPTLGVTSYPLTAVREGRDCRDAATSNVRLMASAASPSQRQTEHHHSLPSSTCPYPVHPTWMSVRTSLPP